MSLSAGRYQLSNAYKSLKQEWESTENIWRDVVRQDFAAHFWEPLAIRMSAFLLAMDRLDEQMSRMRQDCE